MKHTPAPWEFSDMSGLTMDDKPYASAHIGANGEIIAMLGDDYEKRDAVVANARLMASAPELLEALENFVTVCDSAPPIELVRYIAESCEKARAVIKKAKGGAA